MGKPLYRVEVTDNRFPDVYRRLPQQASAAARKVAFDIEAYAKMLAPVDTGALKNSIQARQVGPATWEVIVGVAYGAFVNFGTRFMPARPFFTRAVERGRSIFEQVMKELMSR